MYDRALQALVKLAMEPEWEAPSYPEAMVFSGGLHMMIEAIKSSIKQKPKYVLDADISKCFDQINHSARLGKLGRTP